MSTLSLARGDTTPNLDGANDLKPAPKTSIVIEKEAKVEKPKKTTTPKK